VRFGIYCANFGFLAEPRILVDIAERAERAGWHGFFLYDHIVVGAATVDPWTVLSAVAVRTRLTLGPMVAAVPRRQPWELAHQTIALDRLSEGRLVLGVGLGEGADHAAVGDHGSDRERGDRLDAALDVVTGLWSGEEVTSNRHWNLKSLALRPGPYSGRIPIWVAGRHPVMRPMRRAARYDGAFPIDSVWDVRSPLRPDQLAAMVSVVRAERGTLADFDVVTAGVTPPDPDAARQAVEPFAALGTTWWLEILEPRRGTLDSLLERVEAGPPGFDSGPAGA
jgi:alkanesulfonate monooxygenase SsuD/methylene tetrahydromethanopterin reductase-like flavin-dependent oxidoreductase (luciferase family)